MRIMGLTGYARSGKDTVGQILVEQGWHRVAFGDKVRELALAADPLIPEPGGIHGLTTSERLSVLVARSGWDAAKAEPEVRRFLQAIGTGVRGVLGEETWIDAALQEVADVAAHVGLGGAVPPAGIVVTDVRHQNEAHAVRARGGVIVRVHRPGVRPANAHVTEVGVDHITADQALVNNGTVEDLRAAVDTMLFELAGGAAGGHR